MLPYLNLLLVVKRKNSYKIILDNRILSMIEEYPACNFIRSFATDGIKVVTTGKRKFILIADRLGKITDYKNLFLAPGGFLF
jgi:hypothetical protein